MNRDEILYEQMSELYDIAMEGIFQKIHDKKIEKKKAKNEAFLREKIQNGDIYRHVTNAELQRVVPYIRKEISKVMKDPKLKSFIDKFQSSNPGVKIEFLQNPKIETDEYGSTVYVINNDVYKIVDAINSKYNGNSTDAEKEETEFARAITIAVSNIVNSLKRYPELKDYYFELADQDDWGSVGIFNIEGIRVKDIRELDNEEYIHCGAILLSKRSNGIWK